MSTSAIQPELPSTLGHVVILLPRDLAAGSLPANLWNELLSRAGRVVVVHDRPSVMVELHGGARTLILAAQEDDQHQELLDAVAHYYPGAECHRLPGVESRQPADPLRETTPPRGQPQRGRDLPSHPAPADVAAMLTDEELAMLMGPLP